MSRSADRHANSPHSHAFSHSPKHFGQQVVWSYTGCSHGIGGQVVEVHMTWPRWHVQFEHWSEFHTSPSTNQSPLAIRHDSIRWFRVRTESKPRWRASIYHEKAFQHNQHCASQGRSLEANTIRLASPEEKEEYGKLKLLHCNGKKTQNMQTKHFIEMVLNHILFVCFLAFLSSCHGRKFHVVLICWTLSPYALRFSVPRFRLLREIWSPP